MGGVTTVGFLVSCIPLKLFSILADRLLKDERNDTKTFQPMKDIGEPNDRSSRFGQELVGRDPVYEETNYRLELLIPQERVSEARELFMRIGTQLGQKAIYFEIRDAGEIIDLE